MKTMNEPTQAEGSRRSGVRFAAAAPAVLRAARPAPVAPVAGSPDPAPADPESTRRQQALQLRQSLADMHRRHREELSQASRRASEAGLPSSYIELVLAQLRDHDTAREQLIGLDAGMPTLHLVGSNLIETLKALGWVTEQETPSTQPNGKPKTRYQLDRRIGVGGRWVVNEDEAMPFTAEVRELTDTGMMLITSAVLPRESRLRLTLQLDRGLRAVVSLLTVGSRRLTDGRWGVSCAFNYLP